MVTETRCMCCGAQIAEDAGVYCTDCRLYIMRRSAADDLDAHLADEGLMDPLGATLSEQEQRERFGGYCKPDRE